tara:strand:+ start:5648 stop:6133 length:486 start_codon:yes stop_codon:yes gene_type:complete
MTSIFEKIDGWIIDSIFQPVVDWGRNVFGLKKFSFVAATVFVAYASFIAHILVTISEGFVPFIEIVVLLYLVWFVPTTLGSAKAGDKEGFAPRERFHPVYRLVRLAFLALLTMDILSPLVSSESGGSIWISIYGFFLWVHLNFLGCKNNPPTFRKPLLNPT